MMDALQLQRHYNRELQEGRFREISTAFAGTDPSSLSTLALVGTLRATFAGRAHIAGWDNFVARVVVELDRRGEDTSSLLRGIC